ncbi:MAG: hypothetical protein LAO08_09075 [Acidobacteriia bacterium]|nr:hypothetical protein [Terriglobia bacterium]
MTESIQIDSLPMSDYKAAREEGNTETISKEKLESQKGPEVTGREDMKDFKAKRDEQQGKPKVHSGVQKRIDVLTKRNAMLEERLARYENGNGERQERLTYNERMAKVEVSGDGTHHDTSTNGTDTTRDTHATGQQESYSTDPRAAAARERYRDFDQVMASAAHVRIADEASKELHESPLAGHISYIIAKNPDLASELAKLPAAQQVKEIRRMENDIADAAPGASAFMERIQKELNQTQIEDLMAASKGNPHLLRAIYHNLQELADLSNGPGVYAVLAKDPALSQHIASLPKSKAAVAIGRISASLERGPDAQRPHSNAPAPIRPVSGGTTRSTIQMDQTDMQTYKKLRSQGRVRP